MIKKFAEFLTPKQVERVHDASLEILEKVGMLVRNERAREIFAAHGAKVDHQTQSVTLPRQVVGAGAPLVAGDRVDNIRR